jgi:capsular polysaccharide transport system ATP-binding protein
VIALHRITKTYATPVGRKVLFRDLTLSLPRGSRMALVGANGVGKSTLMSIIAGTVAPDAGEIRREGTLSWPLGFAGGFANDMTGRQNVRFVARIYGAETDELEDYVEGFADLGPFMDMPLRTYSAGMRARLAFGMSLGLRFDWYLVDEVAAVGDAAFRARSAAAFRVRLRDAGLIMVSHAPALLREFCTSGLVIEGGRATFHVDLNSAIAAQERHTVREPVAR